MSRLFSTKLAPARKAARTPLSPGLGRSHICWPNRSLLPLVGRTDSAEGRARRGAPGMEHLTDEGLKVLQPQGPGLADCLGLPLRLMDGGPASTGSPMPGAPPPRSAFGRVRPPPQGGRGIARRLCVNPLAPMEEVESRGARPGEGHPFAAEPAQPSALRPGPSPLPLSRSGEGFAPNPSTAFPSACRESGMRPGTQRTLCRDATPAIQIKPTAPPAADAPPVPARRAAAPSGTARRS